MQDEEAETEIKACNQSRQVAALVFKRKNMKMTSYTSIKKRKTHLEDSNLKIISL